MPANLTPEYKEAEKAYREAKTPEDKLRLLELMLSVIPKHKGTDKLQADLKRKIAVAKSALDEGKKGGAASRRGSMFNVSREGAGQVALCGAPNAGKSSILKALTHAQPEIGEYPYTTQKPQPGMMPYQNVKIQLVDLPPIGREFTESWLPGVVRNADLALLVVNLASDEVLDETEYVLTRLREGKVELVETVKERLRPDGSAQVKARVLGTHSDHPDAPAVLELVREVFGKSFPIWKTSALEPTLLADLPEKIFAALEVVRVYTKTPGKAADKSDPVILPKGKTVMDFATQIHKDFSRNLKYARIWGTNKYDGMKAPRDYRLEDEDVIELHD